MAIKKLVEVWDGKNLIPDNINFLKKETKEVRLPFSDEINQILTDLFDTYKEIPCAGVAANQIGYDKKIFIGLKHDEYNEDDEEDEKKVVKGNPNSDNFEFYINPRIDHNSKKSVQEGEEGCLSIPGVYLNVVRPSSIKLSYRDEMGRPKKMNAEGLMARCIQHEIDHLNGILFIDKVTDQDELKKQLKENKFSEKYVRKDTN